MATTLPNPGEPPELVKRLAKEEEEFLNGEVKSKSKAVIADTKTINLPGVPAQPEHHHTIMMETEVFETQFQAISFSHNEHAVLFMIPRGALHTRPKVQSTPCPCSLTMPDGKLERVEYVCPPFQFPGERCEVLLFLKAHAE